MKNLRIPIHIVFYQEDGPWVAHCLEFDLLGEGATKQQALTELAEAIRLQVEATLEHDNPANLFKPADGRFFAMFAAGADVTEGEVSLKFGSVTIDDAETREYRGDLTAV